jgi:DNA-binding response OmpR family regulator
MKVLIADDKETWHKLFDIVLSLRGIEVLHARSPKEAINVAASEKPDAAVLDVTLVSGTAYDAIKPITELGVPVIVIGHRAEGFDPEKARALGAYATLEKPFTAEELVELLRKIKVEKPALEEKTALVLPGEAEVQEIAPEEEIEIVNLEEEAIEVEAPIELPPIEEGPRPEEAEIAPLELSEGEKVEEKREELVEKISQPVASELSQITSLPPEKVEEIVREIAWEVIPEVAEKVIREEIEKLVKSRLA